MTIRDDANRQFDWADGVTALRRRFANNANVIQTASGMHRLAGKSLHANWIVGRGLCLYRCEDFANVPKNRRRAALALRVPVWSPFERTGHHTVWSGATAMVWLWNADAIADDAPDTARLVPETLFLPRHGDGTYLQACQDGFDRQVWRDGILRESSWFADASSASDQDFRRRLDPAAAETDDVVSAPATLAADPWASSIVPSDWLAANEKLLVAGAMAAFLLVGIWFEARIWHVSWEATAAATELARLEEELGPLLIERTAFLRLRQVNDGLAGFLAEPSQAYLMGLVDRAIANVDATFQQWSYQQRELAVVVEDPALDPIEYIQSLEEQPLFDEVRTELARDANRLEITLKVRP